MAVFARCLAILLCAEMILVGCSDAEQEKERARAENESAVMRAYRRKEIDAELQQDDKRRASQRKRIRTDSGFQSESPAAQLVEDSAPANHKQTQASLSSLMTAIVENDSSTVRKILSHGMDANGQDNDDATPLVLAAGLGHNEIVKSLIEAGADVNKVARTDVSPLHASALGGHLEVVKTLRTNGADLEQTTHSGVTPLFAALVSKNEDVALYLLDEGASPRAQNAVGTTVLDFARRQKLTRVIARINSKKNGSTAATSEDASDAKGKEDSPVPSWPLQTDTGNPNDAEYVIFPSAGLKLLRPDGFADAERFDGFQQEESQASVLVAMIPGPFKESTSELTEVRMKSSEMRLKSRQSFEHHGQSAILLNVTQTANRIEYEKWLFAFGDEKETRLVTATFPKSKGSQLSELLKSAVLSAKLNSPVAEPTPSEGTTPQRLFTIRSSGALKQVENFSIGKGLCFTQDGKIPTSSPQAPLFVAVPSFDAALPKNREAYARQRLLQADQFRIKKIKLTGQIEVDGLEGVEAIATATDNESGTGLLVYQVMLFEDGSYILIQAIVGEESSNEMLEEFKLMARSLKRL